MSKADYKKERFDKLLEECKDTALKSIIGPFGLAKILFEDKDGGNVDTVHNARKGIYATEKEKNNYENKGKYNSDEYHKDEKFIQHNKKISEAKKEGNLVDGYTNEKIEPTDKTDLDHIVSAKEIHDDAGRVLAGIDGKELANQEINLTPTKASINRSKKAKSMENFKKDIEKNKEYRESKIKELLNKENLSDSEKSELNKLKELDKVDTEEALKKAKKAKEKIDSDINKTYYTSKEFITNTAKTSVSDGLKMGVQQALGIVIYEVTKGMYVEIKDIYANGMDKDKSVLKNIGERGKKVINRVVLKSGNIIKSFKDGSLSGFMSSLTTTILNTIITTGKNLVKIIREGFWGLLKAIKLILFTPKGMTKQQAIQEGLKIITASVFIGLGVLIEELLKTFLLASPFAPFSGVISSVVSGLLTGILTAITVYYIDIIFEELNMPNCLETFNELESNVRLQSVLLDKMAELSTIYLGIQKTYINIEKKNNDLIRIQKNHIVYSKIQLMKMDKYVVNDKKTINKFKKKIADLNMIKELI